MGKITNYQDVIDVQEISERIKELMDEQEELEQSIVGGDDDAHAELADWEEDEGAELKTLKALVEQIDIESSGMLIRDSYFRHYAKEEARDLGLISDPYRWPCTCIDWEQAAEDLQQDYTEVDFDGETYWAT